MALGDNLKQLRKEKGLTQGDLSELSGIKLAHISKLERSESDPKLSTIEKLIKALDCSADRLLFDQTASGLNGWLKHSLEAAKSLPARDKSTVIEIVDKYVLANRLKNALEESNPTPPSIRAKFEEDEAHERKVVEQLIQDEEHVEHVVQTQANIDGR